MQRDFALERVVGEIAILARSEAVDQILLLSVWSRVSHDCCARVIAGDASIGDQPLHQHLREVRICSVAKVSKNEDGSTEMTCWAKREFARCLHDRPSEPISQEHHFWRQRTVRPKLDLIPDPWIPVYRDPNIDIHAC